MKMCYIQVLWWMRAENIWSGPISHFCIVKKLFLFDMILKMVELIELLYGLSAVHCTRENPQGSRYIYIYFI